MPPHEDLKVEDFRRILRVVQELHLRGYQRLRIAPGMSASGMHWRCSVTPVSNILRSHGARMKDWDGPVANYTTGMELEFLGWKDALRKTPSALLAHLFLKRFPSIAEQGRGSDWPYAGWYVEMLHLTYPDALPYCNSDWRDDPSDCVPTVGRRKVRIPLPPPGEAPDE